MNYLPVPPSRGPARIGSAQADAESHLAQMEGRYRGLLEAAPDAMVVVNAAGEIILLNVQAEKRFGYSRDELVGQQVGNIIPDGFAERLVADGLRSPAEALAQQIGTGIELTGRRKDGSEFPIELMLSPLESSDGILVTAAIRDISVRKAAERHLAHMEERYRGLLEAAPDAMVVVNPAGEIVLLNVQAEKQFGYSRDELLGRQVGNIIPDGFAERLVADGLRSPAEALAQQIGTGIELTGCRKDGSEFPIELMLSPLESADGILVTAAIRDISVRKAAERHLAQMEERYRGLLEAAPDAMVVVNPAGEIVLLNVQAEKRFGYRRDELIGRQVQNIIPEGFAERLVADGRRSAAEALAQQIGTGIELTGRRKDGGEFPIEIMLSPLENSEGILVTAAIRDITVRKATEDRIVHLNRVYAVLSGINTLIVRVHDRDELFREACRIAVEQGGFRMAWIGVVGPKGLTVEPVASCGVDREFLDALKRRFESTEAVAPGSSMTVQAITEGKIVVSNDVLGDPRVLLGGRHAAAGIRSMAILPLMVAGEAAGVLALYASRSEFFHEEGLTLLRELAGDIAFAIDHIDKQDQLDYLAYYDVLTGLANRRLFLERLAQSMRVARSGRHKLALFLIDLERFKNINDSLGRPAGDELLRQVADWLVRNMGDASLMARISADHFAMMLPEIRESGNLARLVESKMEAFFEHPFHLNDAVFRITAKAGVAVFPADGDDADTLFKNAESALKTAKANGDRYLFHSHRMTETVAVRLTLENQLRQALDNEEFVLHYQPKVGLDSGKVIGAEALIRWNDPRTGLVPPGRFIPVLEDTGLIYEVGRWALGRAIRDYLQWTAAGLPAVPVSVNVSPLQLRNRGFVAEVEQAIGVDPRAARGLELEITESLIMENIKHSIASLQAVRAMGIKVAIDDFGTGFSSLSYLSKLPVDTLKIDRSFVIDMTASPEGLALVSTIINLAHSMKLKVVAEGVETEEQSRLLRLLNCDEMQGFLFSKPLPAELFEARFLRGQGRSGS